MSSHRPPTGSAANGGAAPTPAFTEYKLKMSPMAVSHNLMVLQSTTATLADFTPPVRMIRDKNSALIPETPADEGVAGASARPPVGLSKTARRKTRIIYQGDDDEEDEQIRQTENAPWLLEDYDGQHSFVGRLEGGQSSNYVFFVNQGDEFRIIPVNKWYRFHPKLSYHTLTLEEAETQMAARNKDEIDRWLMRNRTKSSSGTASPPIHGEDEKAARGIKTRLAEKVFASERQQQSTLMQRIGSRDDQREDLDFDEIFDDDEGNDSFGGLDGAKDDAETADSGAIPLKKKNYRLSSEGRMVKKIVRHLDKTNEIFYASDDENDPYASDAEDDEDDDDFDKLSMNDEQKSKGQPPAAASKAKASVTTSQPPSLASSALGSPAASRPVSPSNSPNKRTAATASGNAGAKRSKTAVSGSQCTDDDESTVITEAELVGYLRQGPMSTKDLIAKFKRQLKADPKNKDVFREHVRKVAMVRPSSTGDEDRLLELKPEFK